MTSVRNIFNIYKYTYKPNLFAVGKEHITSKIMLKYLYLLEIDINYLAFKYSTTTDYSKIRYSIYFC